jgi:hypothetical protein
VVAWRDKMSKHELSLVEVTHYTDPEVLDSVKDFHIEGILPPFPNSLNELLFQQYRRPILINLKIKKFFSNRASVQQ